MQHPPTTPLRALLGLTTIAAAAPDLFGSSATVDRRTHAPADTGSGHGPLHPTKLASATRGMTNAADGLGGASGFKDDMLVTDAMGENAHLPADKGAALGLDVEAAVVTDQLS